MLKRALVAAALAVTLGPKPSAAGPFLDINQIATCQRKIAFAGATFAQRVIRSTLKCTNAVSECQIQCELGVYGPSCDLSPPPCCDPDDRSSNQAFNDCMTGADIVCAQQNEKIALNETQKQERIIGACSPLTTEELCGSSGEGLNFATLNAGCQALDPNYTCSLTNLVNCVGGPLERKLVDQISGTLDPRAGDAVAALNLQSFFPDIPVTRKVQGQVAQGKVDVWSIYGQAGDEIGVRVKTGDDNGNQTSNLHPLATLLGTDLVTPVADTTIRNTACSVPNVCGQKCPAFKRVLPFTGTFYLAINALGGAGCTGGKYRLVVVSPSGVVPTLVFDDIDPLP